MAASTDDLSEMLPPMELEIWKGDYGLPSVDPACLAIMAYAKFAGAPLKLLKTNNPLHSTSGHLPVLRHEGKTFCRQKDIVTYLREKNFGADFELTAKQSSEILAYISLLEQKLLPALAYTWWLDQKNYTDVTRPWFHKNSPFPFNFYIPGSRHRLFRKYLEHISEHALDISKREDSIYKEAQRCLNFLSTRLDKSEFFCGEMPVMLDAIVFGYLAPLLKIPVPSARLQHHLKRCENLCLFVNRILHRYFPPTEKEIEEQQKVEEQRKKEQSRLLEFPDSRRKKIVAAIVAIIAMVSYAFWTGIVQVEIVEERGGTDSVEEETDELDFPQDGDE